MLEKGKFRSQKYIGDEINFLMKMFVENGHDCSHTLVVINEKGNHRKETNDKSKTNNIVQLP